MKYTKKDIVVGLEYYRIDNKEITKITKLLDEDRVEFSYKRSPSKKWYKDSCGVTAVVIEMNIRKIKIINQTQTYEIY